MGERNDTISRDFKILKKMKCKGGKPAILTVRGKNKLYNDYRI
jgi:dynein assembly factor 2